MGGSTSRRPTVVYQIALFCTACLLGAEGNTACVTERCEMLMSVGCSSGDDKPFYRKSDRLSISTY